MTSLRDLLPDATPPPGARERVRAGVPARVERARRRRTAAGYAGVIGAAAVAVALVAVHQPARVEPAPGQPIVVHVPMPVPIPLPPPSPGAALSAGLLVLPSGARVLVRPGASAALVRDDADATVLRLDVGVLAAHVEKRPPGRPFVVEAGDTRVEVVGTVFVVERAPAVTVTGVEGTVRVTTIGSGPSLVHGGEVWPRGATAARLDADEAARLEVGAPATAAPATTARRQAARTAAAPPATTAAPSAFAAARALEEAGDVHGARRAYRAIADGDGDEAEDALYAVGRLAADVQRDRRGADATFAEHRRRFANGRYARAVDAKILELTLAAGDWARVHREADVFLAAYGRDARAPRFRLARAVARAHGGACDAARADLVASGAGGALASVVRTLCPAAAE